MIENISTQDENIYLDTDNQVNRSYFLAFDHEKGWNFTVYFSYWNEFNRKHDRLRYVECTALIFLICVSFVINILFITLYCKQKALRTVTNLFIVMVSIASLSILPSAFLIAITRIQRDWRYGNFGCHFVMFDIILMACTKIWIMALISIERMLKIVYFRKRKLFLTKKKAVLLAFFVAFLIPAVSLISMSVLSTQSKTITLEDGTSAEICTINTLYHPTLRISLLLFGLMFIFHYFLPIGIVIGCYIATIHKLKKLIGQMNNYRKPTYNKKFRRTNEKKRAITMLIVMLVATVLMWGPLFGMLGAVTVDTIDQTYQVRSSYFIVILAIILCNTIFNPLLYGFSTLNVRKGIKTLFTRGTGDFEMDSSTTRLKPMTPSQIEPLAVGSSSSNE